MSRRPFIFSCEGARLIATLDEGDAQSGLLLVTGGNEVRSGAWAGQAQLAARLAARGFPVLRFDRRGVGDSEGFNGGFMSSGPDIAAALTAFRAQCPHVTRVIGFGNCDGASALMLARGEGLDGLVLSNPWTIEQDDAPAPPEALRDHYRRRLADPGALRRLLTGGISIRTLLGGLRDALRPAPPPSTLAREMANALSTFDGPVTFLLAERDRTARAFLAAWDRTDPRVRICPGATHSFAEAAARDWLAEQLLDVLRD